MDAAATKPFLASLPSTRARASADIASPSTPSTSWKAKEYGVHTRFIELAGQINRAMPKYVVQRTMEALNEKGKAVKGSRILLLGLSYKPDVDDMRESPTFELLDRFSALGAEVDYHDPHVPVIGPTRKHAKWQGKESVEWSEGSLRSYDAVVISTHHRVFDFQQLAKAADLIIDTRNSFATFAPGLNVVKA